MKALDVVLSVLLGIGMVMVLMAFTGQPDGLNIAGFDFTSSDNYVALFIVIGIVLIMKLIMSFVKKTNEIHIKFFERI